MADFASTFAQNQKRYCSEYFEYLRFKSISTDPAFNADCRKCAEWLAAHLKKIGLSAELLETSSKPVVYGHWRGDAGAPHVVFYGHYDVQPVDPVSEWTTPPFEPTLRNGRVYARGATDNKGPVFFTLKAIEAMIAAKSLRPSISIFIEGEEESGSEGFTEGLPSWKEKLRADVLMVADTGAIFPGCPAITMGLRAVCSLEVRLGGLSKDLHSGMHGGVVKNPATELARLIATLHNPDGSIAVKGFYDGLPPLDVEERKLVNAMPITPEMYKQMVGVDWTGGESAYSPWERRGLRPCIDVNGFHSGYGGAGGKTIIPSSATAKLSTRLVAGQDNKRCVDLIVAHLKERAPKGLTMEVDFHVSKGSAVRLSSKSALADKARVAIRKVTGKEALLMWEGASIPVVSLLAEASGAEPVLVGFELEEDNLHAPNESYLEDHMRLAFLYTCEFLSSL